MPQYTMNPCNYNANELHDIRVNYHFRTKRDKTQATAYKAGSHLQNAIGLSVHVVGLSTASDPHSQKHPFVGVQMCNRAKGLSGQLNIPMDAVPAFAAALLLCAEGDPEFTHHPFIRKARLELEAAIRDIQHLHSIGVK